jgi:hypothetical protein
MGRHGCHKLQDQAIAWYQFLLETMYLCEVTDMFQPMGLHGQRHRQDGVTATMMMGWFTEMLDG